MGKWCEKDWKIALKGWGNGIKRMGKRREKDGKMA